MKKIPIINATIAAARDKTQQAEEALGNAAADARDAKQKAEEAERIASSVQKVRPAIKGNASPTNERPLHLFTHFLFESGLHRNLKMQSHCKKPSQYSKMDQRQGPDRSGPV